VSDEDDVVPAIVRDRLFVGDARHMTGAQVADNSVALLVTSPPYFTGKEYEAEVAAGEVPEAYYDYLDEIGEVLAVCAEKLEPGGRMAVNVANLGRRPYRSLSADVITILQDRLGLLLAARSSGVRPMAPAVPAPGEASAAPPILCCAMSPSG
jgi:site-specific DNA-methyltransferase (adenine-specific)